MKRLWFPYSPSDPSVSFLAHPLHRALIAGVKASSSGSMVSFIVSIKLLSILLVSARGASVNPTALVPLEAKMGYGFSQVFAEKFSNAFSTTVQTTGTRRLDGLLGPKVATNHGPVRFFLTAKGCATTFGFNPRPVMLGTFFSSVDNVRTRDAIADFYPRVGAEGFIGPFGLRLDVGDEVYFANNVYHNPRVTFGPTIRF